MYIHNVRYGFATNSSSTHSIVLLNEGVKALDNDVSDFGWNFFTAASEEAKRQYLGQQIMHAFVQVHHLDNTDAGILASNWSGVEIDPEGYVDRQSCIGFPCSQYYGTIKLRRDFFSDFLKYILNPRVIIVGGNDNDDKEHELIATNQAKVLMKQRWSDEETNHSGLRFFLDHNAKDIRGRYDSTGKFWTLFDTRSGTKIRCSFVPDANAEKSEAPELIDIKITDICTEGCSYCYQGSSSWLRTCSKLLDFSQTCAILGT